MPSRKRFSSTFQKDYSIIRNVLHMVIVCNTLTAPMYDICSGDVLHPFRVYRKAAGRLYRRDRHVENPHRAARFDAGLSGMCGGWGGERRWRGDAPGEPIGDASGKERSRSDKNSAA